MRLRLRFTSRMVAGFAAMSVLLLVGGLVTVLYTYRMQSATSDLLVHSVTCLKTAEGIEGAAENLRAATSAASLAASPEADLLDQRRVGFRALLRDAQGAAQTSAQTQVLETVSARFAEYEWVLQRARGPAVSEPRISPRQSLSRLEAIGDQIVTLVEAFESANEAIMYADLERIQGTNRTVRWAMYGLGASGILLACVLCLAISRSVTKPICQLVLQARDASGYELVESVDVGRGTELEDLDEQIRYLIERINVTRTDLEASHRMLQRSERLAALGRVSAGIAHEIRNPLTSIKMLIYSLEAETDFTDDQKNDLAIIVQQIDRMDRFIDNFLKFARPPDPVLVTIDLNQVIRETLEILTPRARQAHVELVESYQVGAELVHIDPDQIRRVVMNLVLNALDAMPDGGRVTIETRRIPPSGADGGGWVQIKVQDTGIGIPPALMETLFDPLVSGRDGGTGLGLAISHQVVGQHGGRIEVANNPAGGSIFTVHLPDSRGPVPGQDSDGRRREHPRLVPKNAA